MYWASRYLYCGHSLCTLPFRWCLRVQLMPLCSFVLLRLHLRPPSLTVLTRIDDAGCRSREWQDSTSFLSFHGGYHRRLRYGTNHRLTLFFKVSKVTMVCLLPSLLPSLIILVTCRHCHDSCFIIIMVIIIDLLITIDYHWSVHQSPSSSIIRSS